MDGLLVVDASVVIKWFIQEEDAERARLLLSRLQSIRVPQLLVTEVANALWSKTLSRELEREDAVQAAEYFRTLELSWAEDADLFDSALNLALRLNHPVYDCVYLALAQQSGATLVTADKRFVNSVRNTEYSDTVVGLKEFVRV